MTIPAKPPLQVLKCLHRMAINLYIQTAHCTKIMFTDRKKNIKTAIRVLEDYNLLKSRNELLKYWLFFEKKKHDSTLRDSNKPNMLLIFFLLLS